MLYLVLVTNFIKNMKLAYVRAVYFKEKSWGNYSNVCPIWFFCKLKNGFVKNKTF